MNKTSWFKTCEKCGGTVYYKTIGSYYANRNKNSQCQKCKNKTHSALLKGRPRPEFTKEWRKNLALSHKKSKVWHESMNTPEYKEKHRQKMLKMIREGKSDVAFNPRACKVFDFINQKLGWNGLHAGNGKEQVVDVFFLDYYVPVLNVAIEWDEKQHRKPSHYRKDWIKQKVVIETIGCEFYRVDDVSKTVRKIDGLPTNRTNELQSAIREYYEKN